MKDKSLIKNAIQNFDNFSKSQKAVLIVIVEFEKNGVANISVESIAQLSKVSKTIIYKNFIKLEGLGLITREKIANEQVGYIRLHSKAFQPIIGFYIKKKDYTEK